MLILLVLIVLFTIITAVIVKANDLPDYCNHRPLPLIIDYNRYTLSQLFNNSNNSNSNNNTEFQSPPLTIPTSLYAAYTRCNIIPVAEMYVDDSNRGRGTHYKYSNKQILSSINEANTIRQSLQQHQQQQKQHKTKYINFYTALNHHSIVNHRVLIIGSIEPIFESIAISAGAKSIVTSEYNQLTYNHTQIITVTPAQLESMINNNTIELFDSIICYSAIDHDGLGRYNDLLSPDGDLLSIKLFKSYLKPSTGILFLSIPIGPDLLIWNLQRRYGRYRLGLLLAEWEIINSYGYSKKLLYTDSNYRQRIEPVFVLKPKQQQQFISTTVNQPIVIDNSKIEL